MKNTSETRAAQKSISRRLAGAVLIPSAVLLVMWLIVSGYFVFNGLYVRTVAAGVRQVSIPAVNGLASAQRERQLSMAYLSEPSIGRQTLHAQQKQTDDGLAGMKAAAASVLSGAPQAVLDRFNALNGHLNQLPEIRARIDAGTISVQQVYVFYSNLLDAATNMFDTQARIVTDVDAAQGGIGATSVFRATDLMSRASSLISTALVAGSLSAEDHLQFTNLVGSYHGELDKTAPFLRADVTSGYRRLQTTPAWKDLVAAENRLIEHGAWSSGSKGAALPTTAPTWQNISEQVANELTRLSKQQADEASRQSLTNSDDTFFVVIIGSLVALLTIIASIVAARRVSSTLVDGAVINRLRQLRDVSRELTDRLPTIVQRLRDGETVDVEAELPDLHYGDDEIGELADAYNASHHAAVHAAVNQARAREGIRAVFVGIAYRYQGLIRRQLRLLEAMEHEETVPKRLGQLFELHNLNVQVRRNVESLLTVAGAPVGRRWRRPVPLLDVLRAGAAETAQYHRVEVAPVSGVWVVGSAVTDVSHLVAELVANATSFSPPDSQVRVTSRPDATGVIIEVEDSGLGMTDEDRDHANATMAFPPDFEQMAAAGDSRFGLFVIARLAARNGIHVTFCQTSSGVGTLVRVLMPWKLTSDEHTTAVDVQLPAYSTLAAVGAPRSNGALVPNQADVLGGEHFKARRRQLADTSENRSVMAADQAGASRIETLSRDLRVESGVLGGQEPTLRGPVDDESTDQQPSTPASPPSARPQLPQRQPQTHLANHLRDADPVSGSGRDGDESLSPEVARSRMAAFQRGTRDGRVAGEKIDQRTREETGNPES